MAEALHLLDLHPTCSKLLQQRYDPVRPCMKLKQRTYFKSFGSTRWIFMCLLGIRQPRVCPLEAAFLLAIVHGKR